MVELLPQSGVAGEVGETDRELHDIERARRGADVAVAPTDRLQMMTVQRVDRVGDRREQAGRDFAVRARDLHEPARLHERRLDVRTEQRDLGFGDAADRLAHGARELEYELGLQQGREGPEQLEHRDVVRTEAALERTRIGKARRAPDLQREVAVDARSVGRFSEREALAVRSQRPKGGEAQEAALLVGLDELG